jgi:cyclic nucleotide gated channel alpha 2
MNYFKRQKNKNKPENIELLPVKSDEKQSNNKPEKNSDTVKPSIGIRFEKFFENLYLDPFQQTFYIWVLVNTIAYTYNCVFIIARASFWLLQEIDYPIVWIIMDYGFGDLIYLIDIGLKFFIGFMQNGELCVDKRKIAKKYLQSVQFKIDVISLLPLDLFYFILPIEYAYTSLPILRLNRLLKFSRFLEFRNMTETKTKYPTIFRMSNLLINILLVMHWNACIYFAISRIIGFGSDIWVYPELTDLESLENMTIIQLNNDLQTHKLDVQYIYCFWWSVLLMTTIAEVPPPVYYYEEIFMSIEYMIGVVIIAITIGSAAQMVENANRHSLDLQMKGDYAKTYLKQNKISGELELRIKNYLDYLWISSDANQEVLNSLPDNLRKVI